LRPSVHDNVMVIDAGATALDSVLDPVVQARVDILAQRANEGMLSDEERSEYEAFINGADFISIWKLKVQRQLKPNGG
jgi:hypothetical protein